LQGEKGADEIEWRRNLYPAGVMKFSRVISRRSLLTSAFMCWGGLASTDAKSRSAEAAAVKGG